VSRSTDRTAAVQILPRSIQFFRFSAHFAVLRVVLLTSRAASVGLRVNLAVTIHLIRLREACLCAVGLLGCPTRLTAVADVSAPKRAGRFRTDMLLRYRDIS